MKIKILFDKDAEEEKLYTGWGVSFLVDDRVLFDTGEDGRWLMENIRRSQVDINKIEAVVISHDHWDHTGGLWEVLKKRQGLAVYGCPNFSAGFKDKVKKFKGEFKESKGITEISKDIFITGEIAGEYKGGYMPEQAIIARTKKGLAVATGCAHPGIIKIVGKIRNEFTNDQIYLVFGGFHLMDKDARTIEVIADSFKNMAVKKVGPTHCSGKVAEEIFKKRYGDDFILVRTGQSLHI